MQNKSIKSILKATIFNIIVAFFIVITVSLIFVRFGKEKFLMATSFIDIVTVNRTDIDRNNPDLESNIKTATDGNQILINPPYYGENYANLKIDSLGIDLPIYYGKTLDILKNGVGHDNSSYFPGEGGTIILLGHNFGRLLAKLAEIKLGDTINVDTSYGAYTYSVYDTQVVDENDTYKLPIQKDEEILMIYTCWPINNIGYTTDRYVVYAK